MAFERVSCGGDGGRDDDRKMARMMGPGQADSQIRHVLQMIWMMLPPERKSAAEVEKEFRRLADRALKDLRDDAQAFGLTDDSSTA